MSFSNQDVRRQDRLLDEKSATKLLNAKYGVLSMQAEEGGAYAVPISFVWDGSKTLYFHCAPEGRKLRCIALCNKVSFCVVGNEKIIPEKFTTLYESIVVEGMASTVLHKEERMKALELLIKKYSPEHLETGLKYAKNSFQLTEIIKLEIESWSGKCKKNNG